VGRRLPSCLEIVAALLIAIRPLAPRISVRSSVTAAIMLPVTGCVPHGHGRSDSPGPARMAPPRVLLGQDVIGVGLDEQLYEHRVHDVPPGPAAASLVAAVGEFRHLGHPLQRAEPRNDGYKT